ncbi:MAG TPA: M56 family metallopeptidase [Steroidobacteraceae bacterium]|nr:M56 family metallopeptidase [Steroidobacteraceae bacterium]
MILQWLVYFVSTCGLIGAAALLAERALRGHVAARFIWLTALLASVVLPFAVSIWAQQAAAGPSSNTTIAATERAVLLQSTQATAARSTGNDNTTVARVIIVAWMSATACLWSFAMLNLARFAYRRRDWASGRVAETDAYFARDIGPAVIGLLRPILVLPQWFHDLPRAHQAAVIQHERAHISARDPQLLLLAFLVTSAMPWNPLLWWQFARLRRAIELDCDQRVLRDFGEREYGEALIAVAERRSEPLRLALSLLRPRSLLERRIAAMNQRKRKTSILKAGGLVAGSMCLATAAAQVGQPEGASILEQARLTHVDAKGLDRYVGAYRFSEITVMRIGRQDDHLRVTFTGQAPEEIYAQGTDMFFYASPAVDARIEFVASEEGTVAEAVLRQNGAVTRMPRIASEVATQIESTVEQRVAAQIADPHSQQALRVFVEGIIAGRIDRDRVNAQIAGALTKDLPKLQVRLTSLGRPLSYEFKSVGENGIDRYEVRHERGISEWGILVDSNDVITSATIPL